MKAPAARPRREKESVLMAEKEAPEATETTEADKVDSKFRFVLVAAQRAEPLMRGARPKVAAGQRKPTRAAIQATAATPLAWESGPAPQPNPPPAAEAQEPAEEVH